MENASKALIIAGAILISILLIGIGVALINALSAPMDQATGSLDEQTMQIFNSKFDKYVGNKVQGSNVLTLLSTIITSNQAQTNNGGGHTVSVKVLTNALTNNPTNISKYKNSISVSKTYKVEITAYANGYVSQITIS